MLISNTALGFAQAKFTGERKPGDPFTPQTMHEEINFRL